MSKFVKIPSTSEESFKSKMGRFMSGLKVPDQIKRTVELEVVRLVLTIQDGSGSAQLRKITFAAGIIEEFSHFKNNYLDYSQYLNRVLWVATPEFVRTGVTHQNAVVQSDIEYCLSVIRSASNSKRDADLKKIKEKYVNPAFDMDFMTIDKDWTTGKGEKRNTFIPYVSSKIKSLDFLSKYDPMFDDDDFRQDLALETLRVFNAYPKSKGKKATADSNSEAERRNRVEMYIEMALNNKVRNIKEYNTCANRRRVTSTAADQYTERKRLKKIILKHSKDAEDFGSIHFVSPDFHGPFKDDLNTRVAWPLSAGEYGPDMSAEMRNLTIAWRVQASKAEADKAAASLKSIDMFLRCYEQDYYSTVQPLIRREDDSDELVTREIDGDEVAHDTGSLYYTSDVIEDTAYVEDLTYWLKKDGEDKLATFTEIVTSDYHSEFEVWATANGHSTMQFAQRVKAAKAFVGITDEELRQSQLAEWLQSSRWRPRKPNKPAPIVTQIDEDDDEMEEFDAVND